MPRQLSFQAGAGASALRRLLAISSAIDPLMLPCGGGYRALYRLRPDTGRNETAGDVPVLRVFGPHQGRASL